MKTLLIILIVTLIVNNITSIICSIITLKGCDRQIKAGLEVTEINKSITESRMAKENQQLADNIQALSHQLNDTVINSGIIKTRLMDMIEKIITGNTDKFDMVQANIYSDIKTKIK